MPPAPLALVSDPPTTVPIARAQPFAAPFVGSNLSQPFYSLSHDDITCAPVNVSFGGSAPPFQLAYEAYPPDAQFNGSWYDPPVEVVLGVYPVSGTARWNVTGSVDVGSWVRLRVTDGGGGTSFDLVREVKNGTDGMDGCSAPHKKDRFRLTALVLFCVLGGIMLAYAFTVLVHTVWRRCNGAGDANVINAEVTGQPAVQEEPAAALGADHDTGVGGEPETEAAPVVVEAEHQAEMGQTEERPPSYQARLDAKVAGGV